MCYHPIYDEIAIEMESRPEADKAGILEEYFNPFIDLCNKEIIPWMPTNQEELPPWWEKFIIELARFDIDLSPIWLKHREEAKIEEETHEQRTIPA